MYINNIGQAVEFLYSSYLKAEKFLDYDSPDKLRRNPEFTREILDRLGYGYDRTNILVTGSKGKGSVSVMISGVLQTHFDRVGLFTSPHILKINERIRVNDDLISDSKFIDYTNLIYPYVKEIDSNCPENKYVSPIGILAVIALLYFKEMKTDINVLECGKGALYDDVNVIDRDYSVINTIFPEHRRELGKTIEEIAEDKAAIIKKGQKCAYTAKQAQSVMSILERYAERNGVTLKSYGRDFYCSNVDISKKGTRFSVHTENMTYEGIRLPLLGEHQAENCALAIAVCEDIIGVLDEIRMKEVLRRISWPGRCEIISNDPVTILDNCINRSSAKFLKDVLSLVITKDLVTIIGIPEDKDYEGVVEEMAGISGKIILTTSTSPHYRFSERQLENVLKFGKDTGKDILFIRDVEEAIDYARGQVSDEGVLCILGTTALISDVERLYVSHF
jgi:dihydrofolate synthase/folylpolyglutamate synthase